MGNVQTNSTAKPDQIRHIYATSEAKARQIYNWYLEDRFRETGPEYKFQSVSDNVCKPFLMLKDGRKIGNAGVAKVLKNISPMRLTNKINPSMALLLSTILTAIEDIQQSSKLKQDQACQDLKKLVAKTINYIRFGKNLAKILPKVLTGIQDQLANIGKTFEANHEAVNVENLTLWTTWTMLHLMAISVTEYNAPDLYDFDMIQHVITQYSEDFDQLIKVLSRNACLSGFKFEFREESYLTYPMEGQKRWWTDAKVKMLEQNFLADHTHWESLEHKIGQVCLTKGFPKSNDYVQGLVQDPDFLEAWACFGQCNVDQPQFSCVKCTFVTVLLDDFRQNYDLLIHDLRSNFDEMIQGIEDFKLLYH